MKTGRALLAGVAGGAVMSIGMAIGRALGMPGNVEEMMGTMFVDPGTMAFLLGLFIHLAVSGLIASIYAWGFESVTHRAGFLVGLAFAVLHTVIAGLVMGMMPMMHPMIPERMAPPGFFMANLGAMAAMAEVVLHLIHGAIVGVLYGPVGVAIRS